MKRIAHLLLIVGLISTDVWAEQGDLPRRTSGVYLGAGLGYNQVDVKTEQVDLSGSDFSYKVFVGYQFPQYSFMPFDTYFAIEGGYIDIGTVDDDALGANFEFDMHGFNGYFTGYLPITRSIDLFGQAGVLFWDGKAKGDGLTIDDDDGTDLAFGAGFEYRSAGAYSARLTLESFDILDGAWVATLAATWQFK